MLHRNAFVARERVKAVNMSQMKLCPSLTRAIARRRLGRSGLASRHFEFREKSFSNAFHCKNGNLKFFLADFSCKLPPYFLRLS